MGLHDGHRQRMRQQFLSHGPQSMADHELLELALFYAIPRRDTNETAHRLLEQFGSLDRVLTAPEQELEQVDPETAAKLHPHDEKRILRALEVWHTTGKPISQHNRETQALPPRYEKVAIALTYRDRQVLYQRIDQRVDQMVARGLVEEVQGLLNAGVPLDGTAMQAIGYKEFFPYFEGTANLTECTERLKQATRNYAKRQLTWFRRQNDAVWLYLDEEDVTERACTLVRAFLHNEE